MPRSKKLHGVNGDTEGGGRGAPAVVTMMARVDANVGVKVTCNDDAPAVCGGDSGGGARRDAGAENERC